MTIARDSNEPSVVRIIFEKALTPSFVADSCRLCTKTASRHVEPSFPFLGVPNASQRERVHDSNERFALFDSFEFLQNGHGG